MKEVPEVLKELGYAHDSASGATEDKYLMILKLWLRHEHKMQYPASARMVTGTIVQEGLNSFRGLDNFDPQAGPQEGIEISAATRHMMSLYDEYQPRDWDDNKDAEEYEAFREYLSDMLGNASQALDAWQAKHRINQINGEHKLWHLEPRLDVPIMLFRDYYGGGQQADLKCKLPLRNPVKKDGTRSWRVPKPETEPTWQNIWQQAIYWKATGEKPSLLHVTASGYHIWDETNCEALQEDNLERAYNDAVRSWVVTQNLVRAANGNWRTLFGLVQPDFTEIARRHGPFITQLARQAWSI